MSTFGRSDTLQRHFKGRHAEQSNSALNQHLDDDDDAQIRAISLGMLIEAPIEQRPELLRDVGIRVLNIVDGIRLLLCRVLQGFRV
jgi:hypothetical protein